MDDNDNDKYETNSLSFIINIIIIIIIVSYLIVVLYHRINEVIVMLDTRTLGRGRSPSLDALIVKSMLSYAMLCYEYP